MYLDKKVLFSKLDEILSDYNDYQIEYDFDSAYYEVDYSISLTFNHSFTEEASNDFNNMKSIIETLRAIDKNTNIFVNFKDYSCYYSKSTIVEKKET